LALASAKDGLPVSMRIAPPVTLRPNSVPCGPRNTWMEFKPNRSKSAALLRGTKTSSTTTATGLFAPICVKVLEAPRMAMVGLL
jgi:hypothetical protein